MESSTLHSTNNTFYFGTTIDEDDFRETTSSPGAYQLESLNDEIRRSNNEEDCFTEVKYPFLFNENFSALGSNIEKSPDRVLQIGIVHEHSMRDLLGFKTGAIHEEYNLSEKPVHELSFDNIFLETDIAQGMILEGKR